MKHQLLICYQIPKEGLFVLEKDFIITYPTQTRYSKEELLLMIKNFDAVITVFGESFDAEIINHASRLKIISNFGAGVDNIDTVAASKKGILITNTPDTVTEPTAELTIGLMISLARKIAFSDRKLRQAEISWGVMENLGHNLFGKTLGIIGFGKIGKAVAKRAIAMGMRVQYFSRHKSDLNIDSQYIEFKNLDELLKSSDFVSLHVPLNEESKNLIGKSEFNQMKRTAMLINTARGAVVNEEDLVVALETGKIAGAALDVYSNEPVIPEQLLQMDQVLLVPHIGSATLETRIEMARTASMNIIDFFRGKAPKYMVNPQVFRKQY